MDLKEQANERIAKISDRLASVRFTVSPIEEKLYNFEITVSNGPDKIKVQVFFGKKGIKTVIQGNPESELHEEIKNIVYDEFELPFLKADLDEPESYIGSDESGKGDLFGPLVVAAAYLDKENQNYLFKAGIKDSKLLNGDSINKKAKIIRSIKNNPYEIGIILPSEYNKLYEKHKNLNKILSLAHSRVIEKLLTRFPCRNVIIDQFSGKEIEIHRAQNFSNIEFNYSYKAEKYTAVAAASILAREAFNNWFDDQLKKGLNLPKGAGADAETAAVNLLKTGKLTSLPAIAKMNFKTIKRLL